MSKTQGIMMPGGVVRVLSLAAAVAGCVTSASTAQQGLAPQGVTATVTGAGTVRVTWIPVRAREYQVWRSRIKPDTTEATSGILLIPATQWDDAGLQDGVTYKYSVAARYGGVPVYAWPVAVTMPLNLTARRPPGAIATRYAPPPPSQPTSTTPTTTTPIALPPSASQPGVTSTGFTGVQVSSGTVQLFWHPVIGVQGYNVRGPNLPAEGLATQDTSLVIPGLPVGTHVFLLATGNAALYQSIAVTVQP